MSFFSISDALLVSVWLFLMLWLIRSHSFFRIQELQPRFITYVFLLKVVAGFFLTIIYTFYYTDRANADIYKYFDDSALMTDALFHKPGDFFRMLFGYENDNNYFNEQYYNHMNNWFRKYESNIYNDSHTIIRINAVLRIFSFGSFHVHTLFSCFLSLTGLVALYKAFKSFFTGKEKWMAYAIFLLPSVLFWASGVLKESYLMFGLGLLLYSIMFLLNGDWKKWSIYLALLTGILLLLYLKVYVLMALLPGIIGFVFVRKTSVQLLFLKYGLVVLVCLFGWVYFEKLFPSWHMLEILVQKQQDFIRLSQAMNSGSMLYTVPLDPDFLSFIKAAPLAFTNVLLRPFPGESFSPFLLIASAENAILLVAMVLVVFRFQKPNKDQLNLIVFFLLFVVGLFVLIGWVTPVMGAIVRYKVPALPFLGMIVVMLMNIQGKPSSENYSAKRSD
ncbi:MAG TPA: hypothetical protein PK637_17195 [Flavobacteriales bacterium]|nr:hypothetical protein [Flavobacteriales bacterium]HRJ39486.1 hypothetical protein [Flavobacteriales bacterium]